MELKIALLAMLIGIIMIFVRHRDVLAKKLQPQRHRKHKPTRRFG
jgi:hypothetical protein